MNPVTQCLECGAEIPATAKGLCPKCMLKLGLATQFGEEPSMDSAGARPVGPSPSMPFDFGDYRIMRLLGRGGMGAVYEAEHRANGRRIALKVLGHSLDSPEMRKRFLREGRLAAAINHPNSVYIYGTEEIDEMPVIAMELVAGGTLKDEVKRRGPLPVRDAVNAILQIIDGLEAAQTGGVLHRDIKPSNCFLASDGTVKVGDFGLSISTLARGDSEVTASGVMLGTPSFAAPEQLRGEELDLRADIYSVGATLYYLLTVKAPHEGENVVNVVAAALDKPPRPMAEFRQDVPAGLTQIIGRCLAKNRNERFASYPELRDAFLPFSSAVPEPAPLGFRVLAQFIDSCFATLPAVVLLALAGGDLGNQLLAERTSSATLQWLGAFSFYIAYYAILEGIWGAGIGKALCRLRVTAGGSGPPGLARGTLRALIWALLMNGAIFLQLGFTSAPEFRALIKEGHIPFTAWSYWLFVGLTVVTARPRNGFACLHDLASGTRVVVRPKSDARPHFAAAAIPEQISEQSERLGPYRVVKPIAWVAGYDDVLRRHVWIRRCEPGTPAVPPARRDLARPGRLRWLGGARGETGNWDAFDAPIGKALPEFGDDPRPWKAVRYWLYDLAEEIDAAMKDGTLPAQVGVDCVWITTQGRAVLLDEPWPGIAASPRFACADAVGVQHFLDAVANVALDRTQLPLHAGAFLRQLGAGALDRTSFIVGNLRSLLAKPASVTSRRRFTSIASAPGVAAVFAAMFALNSSMEMHHRTAAWKSPPGIAELPAAIDLYVTAHGKSVREVRDGNLVWRQTWSVTKQNPKFAENLAIYIAGHFGNFVKSAEFESHPGVARLSTRERDLIRAAVEEHPQIAPERLIAADAKVKKAIEMEQRDSWVFAPTMLMMCVAMAGVNLICLVAFGTPATLRVFNLAAVNSAGEAASRLRMLWRTALVWIPGGMVVIPLILIGFSNIRGGDFITAMLLIVFPAGATILLLGMARSLAHPTRGPHDRLAGTHIVTR